MPDPSHDWGTLFQTMDTEMNVLRHLQEISSIMLDDLSSHVATARLWKKTEVLSELGEPSENPPS